MRSRDTGATATYEANSSCPEEHNLIRRPGLVEQQTRRAADVKLFRTGTVPEPRLLGLIRRPEGKFGQNAGKQV